MIYTEQNITTIEQPITDPLPFQIEVQHIEHSEQKITDHSRALHLDTRKYGVPAYLVNQVQM